MASTREIRIFGDPVLKSKTADVTDIDAKLVRLADEMVQVMHDAPGLGLAAPQVGVQKHLGADSLAGWLTAHGFAVARAGSRQGYRHLLVTCASSTAPA